MVSLAEFPPEGFTDNHAISSHDRSDLRRDPAGLVYALTCECDRSLHERPSVPRPAKHQLAAYTLAMRRRTVRGGACPGACKPALASGSVDMTVACIRIR